MTATVLLLGAGPEQVRAIEIAREIGLRVVAADGNPSAPGLQAADVGVHADIRDVPGMVCLARRYRADGVFAHAVEIPQIVAEVCRQMGLPGVPPEIARRATDKRERIERLSVAGIACARFEVADNGGEALAAAQRIGFPVVVKPVAGAGARGVRLVERAPEIPVAYEWAVTRSRQRTVLVEEYLEGVEISTETVITRDGPVTTGFADRNYSKKRAYAPFFIEDGHTLPSELAPEIQHAVRKVVDRAIEALDLGFGVAKGDILVDRDGPKVIEMACRTSGGRFCSDMVPLATGVSILHHLLRQAVGEEIRAADLAPRYQRAAAQRFFLPPPGRLRAVTGLEAARAMEGIYDIRFERPLALGAEIPRLTSHADRIGHVIAAASSRGEAVARAEAVVRTVRFDVETLNAPV